MQLTILALLAAIALSPVTFAQNCNCPPTADGGADSLASQSESDGTLKCFYYYGSGPITSPIHGGPGPVLPSCDYDAASGALTGSGDGEYSENAGWNIWFAGFGVFVVVVGEGKSNL
ncbi:hypothetical protein CALVIDRAFT_560287 [Calocera viscosa TUFC12733]|uniref:Uncharacterized protein n=1 Tax=Calocera viscosa (strain TUFC12733) TaxID=1330018 RepID=A0A167RK56_CALVF|nr:hypothetical protein CALVIDRAFT_560287 [Calocera viscosa TUFC12733]